MGEVYWEENHDYRIDLRKAEWSLELQPLYREYNLSLADVDWICEFNGNILLIEYKNSSLQLLSRLLIAPSQCLQSLEQCA